MNWIIKSAINLGLININESKVNSWLLQRNVELLIYSLKKGLYPIRIQAIKALVQLKCDSIIPQLINIAGNDFEVVAQVAIDAIICLDKESVYKSDVNKLKQYWKHRNYSSKMYQAKKSAKWIDPKSRMKNLEHLKQRLKKPIGFGPGL